MENNTRVLLGHSYEREELGRLGGREETNKGLVLEQDKGAPRLEVVEEFRSGYAALNGRESVVRRRREQISREVSVLFEYEDDLICVEPAIPEARVDGTEMHPEVYKC